MSDDSIEPLARPDVLTCARKIKLFLMDVDGTLTDGGVCLISADTKGSRTFLNRGWLEYTGLCSEEASGSGWGAAVHPDDLKRVTER